MARLLFSFANFSQGFGKTPKLKSFPEPGKPKMLCKFTPQEGKHPRQTMLFMANKSISVFTKYT